ncbi:MAG: hypothetical protein ACFFEY_16200 [Candidatus Thorarchaeota archaeon]
MDRLEEITYPPLDILYPITGKADYEYILLWMLNKNSMCTWADFIEKLSGSTIHGYLKKLLNKGCIQKLEKGVYQITKQGKERFSELIYDKSLGKRKLNYPPKPIKKRRSYDHWILWMLYNNPSCKWSDFKQEPLSINQSSLSTTINSLLDKGFIKKENKSYKITSNGKIEYLKVLKSYDLDRQSILEQESKRIEEITERTSEFFNKYDIKEDKIKFRYINYILKLNYSKIELTLKNEEDFNKILLFLTLNHPDQYPNYISPEDFSLKYKIDIEILKYYIYEIVERNFFQIKFFKIIDEEEGKYYFQKNSPFEKMLNVIVEKYITQFTYLNKFQNNATIDIEHLLDTILKEICDNIFNIELKNSLKRFLPEYIKDLAYKIETDKNISNHERNLENFVLQNIFEEFETFIPSTALLTTGEIEEESYIVDKKIFDVLAFFYMSKLTFLKIEDIQDIYNLKTIKKFDQIWNLLYEDNALKARNIYEEIKDKLDYFHQLILQDIILTSEYNFKESIKITTEIIEKFPEYFIGYLFQSITYMTMDDFENSKKVIENGLNKAPHYLLLCQKAQILIKNSRGLEILDHIDKEISKHPKKIALYRIKFMIYITQYDHLGTNHEYPSIIFDSAIKLNPNDAELLLLKSIFHILINKNREAKKLLIHKIELNLFKRNPQIDIATFFILIFSYIARGKYHKALKRVNQLNEFYPNHPLSILSKAFVLGYNLIYKFDSKELNLDLFMQLIKQAIYCEKLKYNKIKFLTLQAVVLYGLNQFDRVIETINKGIELAPNLYYIHYIKIYYLIIANRTNEVLDLIDDLVEKFPDFKYILYDRKSLALFKAKRYEEALKIVDILIDYDPKNIDHLNNKVFILGYLRRKEEAKATAEKLIQLNPKIGNSYDTYGEICMLFGEFENAIEKFEESVRIEPSSDFRFITIIRLAFSYMKINNFEKAREYYEKGQNLAERMIPTKRKFFLQEAKCVLDELKALTEKN